MTKIGLKLWSSNTGAYLHEAQRLYGKSVFDYVELYSVPDSTTEAAMWKPCSFPFVIHCAHSMHGFNLSDSKKLEFNRGIFNEAVYFWKTLSAKWIIVHPGVMGELNQTVEQLNVLMAANNLSPASVLVENKPFITLNDEPCVGASPEAIGHILSESGVGFVLDVTHAIKYAIAAGREWQSVLEQFMAFHPQMLHVSDARMTHPKDEHFHIGSGELPYEEIFSICRAEYLSIETVKDSKENLDDFVSDVDKVKALLQ